MSSWTDSKTASQLSSLTMKLRDKLQSPRRRSETVKVEPADLRQQNHERAALLDRQRDVVSALQYFKALVDRLGLDRGDGGDRPLLDRSVVGGLVGGASSGVLESVQALVQQLENSETVSYDALARLIRWADQVMVQGVSHGNQESTPSITAVIRAVLDTVKDLVRLAADRHKVSAPLSSVQSQTAGGQTGHSDDQETLNSSETCFSILRDEDKEEAVSGERTGAGQTDLAPPKPLKPRPLTRVSLGQSPPALPPKKRQPSSGPAPCRVAIVTPMRQEPEEKRQVEQECEDDCLKRPSSSAESTAHDSHCEDDPDYRFLTTDMSCLDTLAPPPSTVAPPPTLPEKTRTGSGLTCSQTPPPSGFDSPPHHLGSAHSEDTAGPDANKSPPPLPEKTRHIHQYLQFCSFYSDQSTASLYRRHLDSHLDSDSTPSAEHPPALPPKKKQQEQDSTEQQPEGTENTHRLQSDQQEVLLSSDEVIQRVVMKSADDDGPDMKAASADVLLVLATDSGQPLYRDVFLCTYRGFLSPTQVLRRLEDRYRHLKQRREPENQKNLQDSRDCFSLLLRVTDELCVTELDSDLLLLLMDLVSSLLIGGELGPAHLLHTSILSRMEKTWQLIGSPPSLAARSVAARPGTLLDFRSQDLAEQMTLLDSELFYKIQLPEVLMWSLEQNEEKSPNLTKFTQHFNNMSFWVCSVIILQDKAQDREKLLLKFLKVMKHLKKLNNFNSYLSILSALDSAPLRRLDWQRSSCEAVEEMSAIIDSTASFRAYRTALAEVDPPCIPYLGLILQDLTFVHLGNPETLMTSQGSKVNFSKCWQQFNILKTLRSFQQVSYSLQPDGDIVSFFNDFSDHLAQEALWELSLRIRPKNAPRANQR
ncbi:rap guanine nucleotide exchange factor 1-like isoform X5 [Salarias fasciatus]|uniref:CRK SH3-binding GNRP n=1 Tax=Salarias fasciatus TaxID=181472 RepID=A0A672GJC1_SALFA|nr:rap guanine nucleotide exchange factor 1-like isoform X5 [Salarias fasciatus]